MKFNAIISALIAGASPTAAALPAAQLAMQDRVSTLAGCEALLEELQETKRASSPYGGGARLLGRQIEEAARLVLGHRIEADRQRLAGVFKRDAQATQASIKETQAGLKTTAAKAEAAALEASALKGRIAKMEKDLAEARAAAAERVAQATEAFKAAMQSGDESTEVNASEALHLAKKQNEETGGPLALRIDALKVELARLEQLANEASAAQETAAGKLATAHYQAAALSADQALAAAYDAHLEVSAAWHQLPISARDRFPFAEFQGRFASAERALLGDRVLNELNAFNKWATADLVRALAPAKLALLTETAPDAPANEAPLPNPMDFAPGSVQHNNALHELTRRLADGEQEPRDLQSA